jgi:hypothetical protein
MEIVLHSEAGRRLRIEEIREAMTVRDVLALFGTEEEGLWLEDNEVELETGLTLEQAGIQNQQHLHHNRCRRVTVEVWNVDEKRSETFSPSATVRRVLEWALGDKGFNIPLDMRPEYGFLGCEDGQAVPTDVHVGSLTNTEMHCQACLSLVRKINPQG